MTTTLAADLARDLSQALHPAELARRVPDEVSGASLKPDEWQQRFLRSQSRRILINASRQSGKSTCAAVRAAHQALYVPGSLILIISGRAERQAAETFKKTLAVFRALEWPVPAKQQTQLTLHLENHSRIIALPPTESVRGFSGVKLLLLDEASRLPDSMIAAVRPMLAISGGTLIGLSTPRGTRGWFYEQWVGPESWERYEVPAYKCPRIDPEFLEEERRTLTHWEFSQEYMCSFEAASGAVFDMSDIEACCDDTIKPLGLLGIAWQTGVVAVPRIRSVGVELDLRWGAEAA